MNEGYIERLDVDPELASCPYCHEKFDINTQRNQWITQCTQCKKYSRIEYIFANVAYLHKTIRDFKDIGSYGDRH